MANCHSGNLVRGLVGGCSVSFLHLHSAVNKGSAENQGRRHLESSLASYQLQIHISSPPFPAVPQIQPLRFFHLGSPQ